MRRRTTSYDVVDAPNWGALAEGIRGARLESTVYVAIRDFITIAEIAACLGKVLDPIVTWARHASDGEAKGPFLSGRKVLDAALGKKNRRIWIADLASE